MSTYKDAGVNISESDKTVELFSAKVQATYEGVPGVSVRKFGQFAALVHFDHIPEYDFGYSIDGVGTKLLIALQQNNLGTIGECLVAHCANDLLTAGVRARVLLDYVATAGLKAEVAAAIVNSIADACKKFGLVMVGGELAEMPDVYHQGKYDLVACVQGTVKPDQVIDGTSIQENDIVIGLLSSGLMCNGYSLIRKVYADQDPNEHYGPLGCTYGEEFLKPSTCYVDPIFTALENGCEIHGLANITGGGIPGNLKRIIPDGLRAVISQDTVSRHIPEIMRMTQQRGNVPWEDMVSTFNMGIGFIVVVPKSSVDALYQAAVSMVVEIGQIKKGNDQKITFEGSWGSF